MTSLRDAIVGWGTTPEERAAQFPCDEHIDDPDCAVHRAIDIDAPPEVVFRWLCQLRAAPYSYDWIDNWGRRSPRALTPGLERLQHGQRLMDIFNLVDFEHDSHITIRADSALFGQIAVSYVVHPRGEMSRLVVKLLLRVPRNPLGPVWRRFLPAADLVMMRKQLLTLKALAEVTKRAGSG